VIGADSLRRSVAAKGFELAERNVAAVVAGLDRSFTFEKLALAQAALLNCAIFIGTNPDAMLPHGDGYEPGAGSILKAIETASGVAPVIIGKPQPDLLRIALSVLGTPAESTLMIGDQVDTDILAAAAAGLKSILVRTGVPQAGPFAAVPDFDVESLEDIPLPSTAQEHRHG
jgi:4-nitrophenyl phosphatase